MLKHAEQKAFIESESIERNMPQVPAVIWEKAEAATIPWSPKVLLNMILGTLVGLIVGVGLAFLIEYLDTSIKTMDDVESLPGVPVLAVVPKRVRLLHKNPPDIPDAEAYRIPARTSSSTARARMPTPSRWFPAGRARESRPPFATTTCSVRRAAIPS